MHLEHYELSEARSRLKEPDTGLNGTQDTLIGAVAWLVAAGAALPEGRAAAAAQIIGIGTVTVVCPGVARPKAEPSRSRGHAASGNIQAALAAAGHVSSRPSLEAAVTLAHAWAAPGDRENARRVLGPALAALGEAPDRVRLDAWLVDVRLSDDHGDHTRGRRSLASALRHAAGMLSTAEIASEMYLSINTVKTHLRQIYRKLAAPGRGPAVRRARQLELI